MARDIGQKPALPGVAPEKEEVGDKKVATQKARRGRRDLGQVGEIFVRKAVDSSKPRAYKQAYFNRDSSGVRDTNLNTSKAGALRGDDGITDLRKIVLPASPSGIERPDPKLLRDAMEMMGLKSGFRNSFADTMGRQGRWAQGQGMTIEMIEERMRQLEEMVKARKIALGRMAEGRSEIPITSVTVVHAATSAGEGLEGVEDLGDAGTSLAERTSEQASGMHARIAKMLGIKPSQE